jgi:hypothetical protein
MKEVNRLRVLQGYMDEKMLIEEAAKESCTVQGTQPMMAFAVESPGNVTAQRLCE